MSKTETIEGSDLRDVNVKADYSQVDDTWLEYGYRQVPMAATTATGEYMGPSGTKLILQKSEFDEKQFLRTTMPQTQPFIPMEAVQYTVIDKLQNNPEVKRRGIEFDEPVIKESHYGNSRFWIIQTNINAIVKGSHIEDDKMQLGFVVRNGYNTGVALGFDMCNLRVVCSNGTIVRGQDFGTTAIAHVGNDAKLLLERFSTAMLEGLDSAHRLIEFYESLTKLKINQKIAEHLYKTVHMPDKYFPDYMNIQLSKKGTQEQKKKYREAKKVPITLTADGKGKSMWEVFNDITKPLWHAMDDKELKMKDGTTGMKQGINIYSVSRREQNLHRSMSQIMENRSRFI
jgi:hypothetical protein